MEPLKIQHRASPQIAGWGKVCEGYRNRHADIPTADSTARKTKISVQENRGRGAAPAS